MPLEKAVDATHSRRHGRREEDPHRLIERGLSLTEGLRKPPTVFTSLLAWSDLGFHGNILTASDHMNQGAPCFASAVRNPVASFLSLEDQALGMFPK